MLWTSVATFASLLALACSGSAGPPLDYQGARSTSATTGSNTGPDAHAGSGGSGSGSGSEVGGAGAGASSASSGGASTGAAGDESDGASEGSGSLTAAGGPGGSTAGSMQGSTSATSTAAGGSGGMPVISMEACGPVTLDVSSVDHAAAGRIVVLGSSTAEGKNASSSDKSWVGRYQAYLAETFPNFAIENLAVGGFDTYRIQASDFVPPEGRPGPVPGNNITTALEKEPDGILINMPSNDQYLGFSIEEQIGNYERVAELAEARGVLVWVATSQPRDFAEVEQRQGLMDVRDAIQEHFAPRAIDFWTDLANPDGTMKSSYNSGDGTHFNDAGHAVLAQLAITCAIPEVILSSGE